MINFDLSDFEKNVQAMFHGLSETYLRPISKRYDTYEHEHEKKNEFVER